MSRRDKVNMAELAPEVRQYISDLRGEAKTYRLRWQQAEAECEGLRIALAQKLSGGSGNEWINSASRKFDVGQRVDDNDG